jgi:hypothetical protein
MNRTYTYYKADRGCRICLMLVDSDSAHEEIEQ